MSNRNYDIIIAGAGASGLTLLWYLLQSDVLADLRILLIDQKLEADNSKTWCFWEDETFPIPELIYHTWESLEVKTPNNIYSEKLNRYKYHCIRSIDYSAAILEMAKNDGRVDLLETSIKNFSCKNGRGIVETVDGEFSADWVFQSVLPPPGFERAKVDISLLQHFVGWEIEAESEIFNPERAVFMDFVLPQKNGVTFMYVLPFSKKRALVEYTLFTEDLLTNEEYEAELKTYLEKNYHLTSPQFKIIRREQGAIPMEDRSISTAYCEKVMNLGMAGGFTKPSTGYTFRRIHKRCRKICEALEKNKTMPIHQVSSYRFRVYDMLLLYLLKNDLKASLKIFDDLFKKNRFDRVLQFLDEKTSFLQELAIISKFSWMPFFKSIYKMKHRIFTGA